MSRPEESVRERIALHYSFLQEIGHIVQKAKEIKKMPNDPRKIQLWYSGLGKAYHLSRGPMGALGCYDAPPQRRFAYLAAGVIMSGMGATCVAAAWVIYESFRDISWLSLMCALAAVWALLTGIVYLKAYSILKNAIALGQNPDYHDPIRIRSFERAYRWGVKNQKIRQDVSGREAFVE